MSCRESFMNADAWSAADVSVRLNTKAGNAFLKFLHENGVDTIIRYYASSARPKTITPSGKLSLRTPRYSLVWVFATGHLQLGSTHGAGAGRAPGPRLAHRSPRLRQAARPARFLSRAITRWSGLMKPLASSSNSWMPPPSFTVSSILPPTTRTTSGFTSTTMSEWLL